MSNKNTNTDFQYFVELFPEVELPATLGEDTHLTFSRENDPLPAPVVQQHILPIEEEMPDEFTEYIACFRIPKTYDFHALVFWKAGLMNYQYILATFDKHGVSIDKRVIAGTFSDGEQVTQSVATIDHDWTIFVASGQTNANKPTVFDPTTSRAVELELLPDGKIIAEVKQQ